MLTEEAFTREHYCITALREQIESFEPFSYLFQEREQEILRNNLLSLVPEHTNALLVFCRLDHRKHNWYKSEKLFEKEKSFEKEMKGNPGFMNEVIDTLMKRNLLEQLTPTSSFADAWSTITDCLTTTDLDCLLRTYQLKCKGDKDAKLSVLFEKLSTGRRLFSKLLLKDDNVAQQVLNSSKSFVPFVKNGCFVRIHPTVQTLLRRYVISMS